MPAMLMAMAGTTLPERMACLPNKDSANSIWVSNTSSCGEVSSVLIDVGWSVDFGSFKHGDITITSSRTIEQLFNGYDPRNGIYPEWRDVRIVSTGG